MTQRLRHNLPHPIKQIGGIMSCIGIGKLPRFQSQHAKKDGDKLIGLRILQDALVGDFEGNFGMVFLVDGEVDFAESPVPYLFLYQVVV